MVHLKNPGMKRIIFINRYFFPDHSATSQILSDLAFHLATSGYEIHVVTGNQLYDDPHASLPAEEEVRGVRIHRVMSTKFGRSSTAGRALDYLSLYRSMHRAALEFTRAGDVLVAKTDPPMLSVVMSNVAKQRRAELINWLQDLYPEVAVELGVPLLRGPLARTLGFLRDRSLRGATANVVLGDKMADKVRNLRVDPDRIRIIHNWTNDEQIVPIPTSRNPLRREWKLNDNFVVGYSGNLGRAHEFDTLLHAADRLRSNPRIIFLFVGGGGRIERLKQRVRQMGLEAQFQFRPYQDRERLSVSLSVPDVHWISLRPQLEGLIVPSKLYGVLAAGRPIIAVAAPDGEVASIIERAGCGATVEPDNATALADTIYKLSSNPDQCIAFGRQARLAVESSYNRAQAFVKWEALLKSAAPSQLVQSTRQSAAASAVVREQGRSSALRP